MKYITLTDLREWIFAYDRQEITMSRFQELINEKVEEKLKGGTMTQAIYTFKFNKSPRKCKCGKKYVPKAPNQKYCDSCKVR